MADAWWTTFYHLFVWIVVVVTIVLKSVGKFRTGLIGLLAIDVMLLMDTANTFLYFNQVDVSGGFKDRTRVTFAGGLISSIGVFLLIIFLGMHDEAATFAPGKARKTVDLTAASEPPAGRAEATATGDAVESPAAMRV